MCDFVLITVQPGGADILPGAAGGGAGDRSCAGSTFAAAADDHIPLTMKTSFKTIA